jgi:hypothetical protein
MTFDKPSRTQRDSAGQSGPVDELITPSVVWQPGVVVRQYLSPENPQFSILDLMVITGICAVAITAIRAVGVYGVFGLFFCCFFMWVYLRKSLDNPTRLRFWNQFMWGILMPIGCIFGDPFVFGRFDMGVARSFNFFAFACYAFMAWEVVCLAASFFVKPAHRLPNLLLAGSLLAGAIFAFFVALVILPFTLLGLIVVLGVIGFTPWFTANVYLKTALMLWRRAETGRPGQPGYLLVLAGLLFSILVGVAVFVLTQPILLS